MKLGIMAIVVGLFGLAGLASADFMMIKIDLNQIPKTQPDPNPGGQPPPQPGFGGNFGQAGGEPGKGGFGGGQPMPPPPGGMPPNANDLPPLWVHAYLELKTKPKLHQVSPQMGYLEIEHPWGKQNMIPTNVIRYFQKDSLLPDFNKRLKEEQKKGKLVKGMLDLANWALTHGLTKQFHETMAELKKEYPKDPAVLAYNKVQADLKKKITEDDPAARALLEELRNEGYRVPPSDTGGHYKLLTNLATNPHNDALLKRYMTRMEETFENFFYWFTIQKDPQVLPMPQRRLIAILVANPKEFEKMHVVWGSLPRVADGFTPRRENVMVLSAQRRDEPYTTLKKNNEIALNTLWTTAKVSKEDLLGGAVWKRKEALANAYYLAQVQSLILVQRAMEDESERATISHEGTRQLLAATGLLPRNVEAPEWVQTGIAAFFDTPHGAYYPGLALPSWTHLVNFKYYRKTNKLGKSSEVLYQLVTDHLFRKAEQTTSQLALAKDDKIKPLAEKSQEEWEAARASSWAFVYFLAYNHKLHYLKKYLEEINQLPRDLQFDDRVLQGCFARAFQMVDNSDPNRIDSQKFQQLADAWFAQMERVTLEIADIEADSLKAREQPKTPPPAGGAAPP